MIDDGVQGLLVPPRDAEALAQAIASLLADPGRRRSMGEAGRKRARDRYSLEAGVLETETLYERLLQAGGKRVPRPIEATSARAGAVSLAPPSSPVGDEEWR